MTAALELEELRLKLPLPGGPRHVEWWFRYWFLRNDVAHDEDMH